MKPQNLDSANVNVVTVVSISNSLVRLETQGELLVKLVGLKEVGVTSQSVGRSVGS